VYAFVGRGFSICNQLEGWEDVFTNNYLVQDNDGDYGNPTCSGAGTTVMNNNQVGGWVPRDARCCQHQPS